MIATHRTSKACFNAIRADGFIRSREHLGNSYRGKSFPIDLLAKDNRYIFFSYSHPFFNDSVGTHPYGFAFKVEYLIYEQEAFVGPDLMTEYDNALIDAVRAVTYKMKPKDVDTGDLEAFFQQHAIVDTQLRDAIIEAERDPYQDVLDAVFTRDLDVDGTLETLARFEKSVTEIQAEHRHRGTEAMAILMAGEYQGMPERPIEILVDGTVPINKAIAVIQPPERSVT